MKRKAVILGIITMTVLLLVAADNRNNYQEEDRFSGILDEYNVLVKGDRYYLTDYQLNGFLMGIDDEYICTKYENYMQSNAGSNQVSPEDILELHYYSLHESEREVFLKKIQNQEVTIDMGDNGAILISYNVNK